MGQAKRSLFMFLMGLAWKYRYSIPMLLSCSAALLGNAWVLQISIRTHRITESELEDMDDDDDESDTDSNDSWETVVEDVTYG